MRRERALRSVLRLRGLIFVAAVYPLILMARQDPALAMMMSLYVTLGVFLLLASRDPSAHRSLIASTAWSSTRSSNVLPNLAQHDLAWRTDRVGCARRYRSSSNRAGSGKAIGRAVVGRQCLRFTGFGRIYRPTYRLAGGMMPFMRRYTTSWP
jgi:hypothetical protein